MKIKEIKKTGKIGRVSINGVFLEPHEHKTIRFLAEYGMNIEAIRASNTPGVHTADILVDGAIWEMKAAFGGGKSTILRQFRGASKPSDRMVLDLRNAKLSPEDAEKDALGYFKKSRGIRRLRLITKEGKLLDIFK